MVSTASTKRLGRTYSPWTTPNKYRPTSPKSYNVPMISGRRRLRSSAALKTSQTSRIAALEALLCSLVGQLQDELQAMAHKSTTSLVSAQPTLMQ